MKKIKFPTHFPHSGKISPLQAIIFSMIKGIKKRQKSLFISLLTLYPGSDLNRYVRNEHRILSPACLPIPPPGQSRYSKKTFSYSEKVISWSERRGSNPRPRPWQGRALPTELLSLKFRTAKVSKFFNQQNYLLKIVRKLS